MLQLCFFQEGFSEFSPPDIDLFVTRIGAQLPACLLEARPICNVLMPSPWTGVVRDYLLFRLSL